MLRVRVTTTGYAGAPGLSQFYFVQRSDPATTDLALAEDAYARVQAGFVALKGAMPNVWHWVTDGNLDIMDPATGELTGTIVGGSTGGDAGELSTGWGPLANAMCITWLTQGFINGHRVRGRTFVSPIQALSDSGKRAMI